MTTNEMLYPDFEISEESGWGGQGLAEIPGWNQILMSANPLQEIKKALSIGYTVDPASMTDGAALRVESLESTLKNLTITDQSTTLFNHLLQDKKDAESTVEQYTTIDDISEAFTYEEGGLPAQEDDAYSRRFEPIKYIGAIGSVTNVILRTNNLVNAREAEIKRKMLAIKRKANIVSYFGDKSKVPTEFDGLLTHVQKGIASGLVPSSNIIDLQGKRLNIETINEGTYGLLNVSGFLANFRIYASPAAKFGYLNELLKDKRYITGEVKAEVEGLKANRVIYQGGEAPIFIDMFLNPRKHPRMNRTKTAFITTGSTPPATPTITSATPGGSGGTIPAGTYDYAVVAVNKYGHKSIPQMTNGADVIVAAGQKVTFVLADGGSPAGQEATAFELYRRPGVSTLNTDFEYVTTFKVGDPYVDDGSWIPGTSVVFGVEWDRDEVLAYHQLMEAALFPLGAVADSPRWLQRLYGALLVYNPKKIQVWKNVGQTSWT